MTYVDYDYDPCKCLLSLSYEEKENELAKIINSRVEIDQKYKRFIIISDLEKTRLSFNNISLHLRRGISHFCLCGIRRLPYVSRIFLASDLLSTITQVPCSMPNAAAYYVRSRNHQVPCPNVYLPSLQDLAFISLYLKGYSNQDFENFIEKDILPRKLAENRPDVYGQVIYTLPNHLAHYSPSILSQYTASCANHKLHIFSYID